MSDDLTIFYLCNGRDPECFTSNTCFNNGGPCHYTNKPIHARNFNPIVNPEDHVDYFERDDEND